MKKLYQIFGLEYPQVENSSGPKIEIRKIYNGFELDFNKMYSAPPITFKLLKEVSELFGTDKIDVDSYAEGG